MTVPDPNELRLGPIRHLSLPDDLLERVRAIYDLIGPYLDTTLEQFEIGFMRDASPEDEVAIWAVITSAWIDYHDKHLSGQRLPDEEEKRLIGALIAISTGVTDVEKLGVSDEVGRKLLTCYDSSEEWVAVS